MQFTPFDKIPRLSREMTVTEKLDGTNASIYIAHVSTVDPVFALDKGIGATDDTGLVMFAGSRTRWITPADDNYGFARWAQANAADLFNLGVGHHFGEWWGQGIQRGYGLNEKRFSLFNVGRWYSRHDSTGETLEGREPAPECCHTVPVLLRGPFDTDVVDTAVRRLHQGGSYAAPGFMKPEGVIVWHDAARQLFKKTCERDDAPKGVR